MPFGNSVRRLSRRDIVRIAQRFNAGLKAGREASPGGTTEKRGFGLGFCRPSGTLGLRPRQPSVETLGYYRMSLRDKLLPEFPKGVRDKLEYRNGITTKNAEDAKSRHLHRRGRGRNRPPGRLTKPFSLFVFSAFFAVNFGIRDKPMVGGNGMGPHAPASNVFTSAAKSSTSCSVVSHAHMRRQPPAPMKV